MSLRQKANRLKKFRICWKQGRGFAVYLDKTIPYDLIEEITKFRVVENNKQHKCRSKWLIVIIL